MRIFQEMLAGHKEKGETVFSGADAFKLYDTYGFPIDLTAEMVDEQGMRVDEDAFQKLMQEQKTRAREARKALGDLGWAGVEFGKEMPATEFVGYDRMETEAKILALVSDEELRDEIGEGAEGIVVLDRTTLYAEMGGQVADHGVIRTAAGEFTRDRRAEEQGRKVHALRQGHRPGTLRAGEELHERVLQPDSPPRLSRARNSATHLLHVPLRRALGDHVHQAGSLVEPDRLRFDLTHFEAVKPEELAEGLPHRQQCHHGGRACFCARNAAGGREKARRGRAVR